MTLLPAVANHLWQSTLFAAVVAALTFTLRKNRAGTRSLLWLIASVKFLVPFSLLLAAGSYLKLPQGTTRPAAISQIEQIEQIGRPLQPFESFSVIAAPHQASVWPGILLAIWACGFVAVLFSWWRRSRQIRSAVRSSTPLDLPFGVPVRSVPVNLEPGIFGLFRQILLLPEGIQNRLDAGHLDAILAHELCHARRHDNLAAAVHMLVEAVFWFYPLVWWIGSRMIEERENACDEEVIRMGNHPEIYAESILKTCRFYLESPVPTVSGVTGSDLKKRIVRIMTSGAAVKLNFHKKLLLATAGAAAVVLPLAAGLARAQSDTTNSLSPTFEVVSIKPSDPNSSGIMIRLEPNGRFVAQGINMKTLMEEAYDVKDGQILHAPAWIGVDHYDISAKPDEAGAAMLDKLPLEQRHKQLMKMIQAMLEDRFQLKLAHDKKELPVYALTVSKNGPKLQKSSFVPPDKPGELPPPSSDGKQRPGGLISHGPGSFVSTGTSIRMLANVLSHMTGGTVIDETGLTGLYDYELHWTPEPGQGPGPRGGPPRDAPPPDSSAPPLTTALQEQLGLKLETKKALLDVLVVEHVEKPSAN